MSGEATSVAGAPARTLPSLAPARAETRTLAGVLVIVGLLVAVKGPHDTAQSFVNGVSLGSVYALGAVGLTLVYGILRLSNFAHAELLTFGAYVAFVVNVSLGSPFAIALAGGAIATAALALALERGLWRPVRARGAGVLQQMLISIGLAFVLRGAMQYAWGTESRQLAVDTTNTVEVAGLRIGVMQLLVVVLGALLLTAIGVVLKRTALGKSMRAVSDDPSLAGVAGIDTDRVIDCTWLFAGLLAGVAGVMVASITVLSPTMGFDLLLPIFAAVILGGIGNVFGALVGGLTLGVAIELSTLVIPDQWKMLVGFGALLAVLALRPSGIFGRTTIR